jgi:phage terminase large subunit
MAAIKATVNFEHIEAAKAAGKDGVILQGSAGSSKTFSALQWLAIYASSHPNQRISCYRQFRSSVKETLVADFLRIMSDEDGMLGLLDHKAWNASDLIYRFDNGSVIRFNGCDKAANRKGKRDDISYMNEVTEINYDSFNQIAMRTSFVIADFNPSYDHFIYKFRGNPDYAYHDSTFRDNPLLPEGERRTILGYEPTKENINKGTADEAMWNIYGLGKPAILKGLVFTNWVESDEWPDISACERVGYGCDVGFVDPTTVVECRFSRNTLFLKQHVYETGLTDLPNPEQDGGSLVEACDVAQIRKDLPIYVDCAYPQTVKALRSYGYNAISCEKGKGSILEGIALMRRFKIALHPNSRQLIREFASYTWKKDPQGIWKNEPVDDWNHLIDAVRYWCKAQMPAVGVSHKTRARRVSVARGGVKRF